MNRLMKMAGFMPVILGTLCACQSASTERYDIANKKVCQNAHLHYFTYKAPTFTSWGFVIT